MNGEAAVMVSIRPEWVELIAARKKTAEVRKDAPKKLQAPFKCYIYQTQALWFYPVLGALGMKELAERLLRARGKVAGEFICDRIGVYTNTAGGIRNLSRVSCVSTTGLRKYCGQKNFLNGWYISHLKVYDRPRELSEFGLSRAPQSWCYVKEAVDGAGDTAM